MSEMKDEEIVEQGSGSGSSGSSGSEQMVEAEIELEESPPPLEEEEEEEEEEGHGNHSGNSDSSKVLSSDGGDKNVESAEEAHQLNGDVSAPPTYVVDESNSDVLAPLTSIVDESNGDVDVPAPTSIVDESNTSVVQTEVVTIAAAGREGGLEVKVEGNGEESNKVEGPKYINEPKDANELKKGDSEDVKDKLSVVVDGSVNAAGANAVPVENGVKEVNPAKHDSTPTMSSAANTQGFNFSYPTTLHMGEEDDGTEEEQIAFLREVESFCRERNLEFKHPKFYGEGLNCLKLWRAVTRLGGYDRVTACKLWRQVGESFHPPKTCTTVSWSFRIFYEKSLLDYERHKLRGGEFVLPASPNPEPASADALISGQQGSGGRQRRDAAARAMQGWHFRLHGNGEVGDSIIKDKSMLTPKREKQVKSGGVGVLKRKKSSSLDRSAKAARTATKVSKPQIDTDVIDVGTPPADWVKINVLRTKDCFEVYALVPGLLREEVRVQSDPAGRLVISGDPEQPDNPWGVTPFKKIITLPSRIDPHQTSAVVTLHGQLFVRVPFEQTDL